MSERKEGFVPVSDRFFRDHHNAVGTAFPTLFAIECHARGEGKCTATDKRLSYVAGVPMKSLKRHLNQLERLGYIDRTMVGWRRRVITVKISMISKAVKRKKTAVETT